MFNIPIKTWLIKKKYLKKKIKLIVTLTSTGIYLH